MLQPISTASELTLPLERFIAKAEAFLTNHYINGSDTSEIEEMLICIENLKLDIDKEALQAEYESMQEQKDLLSDYSEHHWIASTLR